MMSGNPIVLLLRKKNVDTLGRYNPMVTSPSPSQSPTTGMSPGAPKAIVISGNPAVLLFLKKKKFPLGRNSPIVSDTREGRRLQGRERHYDSDSRIAVNANRFDVERCAGSMSREAELWSMTV